VGNQKKKLPAHFGSNLIVSQALSTQQSAVSRRKPVPGLTLMRTAQATTALLPTNVCQTFYQRFRFASKPFETKASNV
jgi:hypothetical protein